MVSISGSKKLIEFRSDHTAFLAKVFGLFISQLVLMFTALEFLKSNTKMVNKIARYVWVFFVLDIIAMFSVIFASWLHIPFFVKLVVFLTAGILHGMLLGCAANILKWSSKEINIAILATIGIFALVGTIGYMMALNNIDLSFLWFFIIFSLLGLMIAGLTLLALGLSGISTTLFKKIYYAAGICIFTLIIAYDIPNQYENETDGFMV